MSDHDYERRSHGEEGQDALDSLLNRALAKYSAAEPRPGLEERILAGLRTAPKDSATPAWRRWFLVPAAATVVIAIALWWQFALPSHTPTANLPPVTQSNAPALNVPVSKVEQQDAHVETLRRTAQSVVPKTHRKGTAYSVTHPKLEQFPSPQPLSEQELALAKYASAYPQEAALIATAQVEFEKETQRRANQFRSQAEAHTGEER
jgi:hypothetical protein